MVVNIYSTFDFSISTLEYFSIGLITQEVLFISKNLVNVFMSSSFWIDTKMQRAMGSCKFICNRFDFG